MLLQPTHWHQKTSWPASQAAIPHFSGDKHFGLLTDFSLSDAYAAGAKTLLPLLTILTDGINIRKSGIRWGDTCKNEVIMKQIFSV